jgi:flagellar biosynthesis/type III secretory pathway protein FliH
LSPELEPELYVELDAAPSVARLAAGSRADAWERVALAREARARAQGRREGEREANAGAAAALSSAVERLDSAREAARDGLANTAVDLAVEVVRTLLRVELEAGRYDLEGMVREALSFSGVDRGKCVVHLHPQDAARLEGVRFRSGTTIEADEGVARGSVHVTTPQGLLVRDLDEAVRSIAERLRGEAR